jgi:hypothetical protein
MPAVTDYITAQCPGLAGSPSISVYIADATNRTNQAWFGVNYAKAVALRAMHEYTLDQRNLGAGGEVASLREGGASLVYSTSKGKNEDDLSQTSFGKRLIALIRNSGAGASVTGFNNVAAAGVPVLGAGAGMITQDDDFVDEEY